MDTLDRATVIDLARTYIATLDGLLGSAAGLLATTNPTDAEGVLHSVHVAERMARECDLPLPWRGDPWKEHLIDACRKAVQ